MVVETIDNFKTIALWRSLIVSGRCNGCRNHSTKQISYREKERLKSSTRYASSWGYEGCNDCTNKCRARLLLECHVDAMAVEIIALERSVDSSQIDFY